MEESVVELLVFMTGTGTTTSRSLHREVVWLGSSTAAVGSNSTTRLVLDDGPEDAIAWKAYKER